MSKEVEKAENSLNSELGNGNLLRAASVRSDIYAFTLRLFYVLKGAKSLELEAEATSQEFPLCKCK